VKSCGLMAQQPFLYEFGPQLTIQHQCGHGGRVGGWTLNRKFKKPGLGKQVPENPDSFPSAE
jgi:hypothetical protein